MRSSRLKLSVTSNRLDRSAIWIEHPVAGVEPVIVDPSAELAIQRLGVRVGKAPTPMLS